jgi:hypothetical protein
MTEKGTLYVKGASTKSGETRTLEVSDGTKAVGTTETETTGTFDLEAGTYYIYSTNKGINVSLVGVVYDSSKEDSPSDDDDDNNGGDDNNETTTVVYGDADNSGDITSNDASVVLEKSLNLDLKLAIEDVTSDYMAVVDVDGNGTLDSNDASLILQKALNPDYAFPIESK